MTKDIEKLSAWYDGEISQEDFDKGLENLGSSSESKKILHQYAILSELMQRKSKPQVSNLAQLSRLFTSEKSLAFKRIYCSCDCINNNYGSLSS